MSDGHSFDYLATGQIAPATVAMTATDAECRRTTPRTPSTGGQDLIDREATVRVPSRG